VLLAATVGGFSLWAVTPPDPGTEALAALESDDRVRVSEMDGYTFEPAQEALTGFILYQGARVDPASYSVPARMIAEKGYLVIVPQLTLNLAVLDANAADAIIAAHPDIDRWVIGGHSLGGAMAAGYAHEHQDAISGLVLWAAYPAGNTDLSTFDGAVTSVFGTRDGLTSLDDIDDSRPRLPEDTDFAAIEGGNHAQFGDYGPQAGDNPATISREEQQTQVVEATVRILRAVDRADR
jgi:dienelactone hydrolase